MKRPIEDTATKSAARSKRYRENLKSAGVADARAVDRAIVDAVAFLTTIGHIDRTSLKAIVRVTHIMFKRDGVACKSSAVKMAKRLYHRHSAPTQVPSPVNLHSNPPKGAWNDRDISTINTILAEARRHSQPVKAVE